MTHALSHLNFHSLPSRVLRGNPMGNNPERTVAVLNTPHKGKSGNPPLVCYVLDGYFGNGTSMLSDPGPVGRSFAQELLDYQQRGLLPPTVFVFVDASTRIGGSQYINSESCGRFEDHIFDELIPFVEKQYEVRTDYRLITGHSSGGYGSLCLPLRRPGVFQASLISAADSCFEHSLVPCFAAAASRINSSGGVDAFLDAFFAKSRPERCSQSEFSTIMILAMASCYSPQLGESSIHAELPFNTHTLERNESVWQRWRAHDPVNFSDSELQKLKELDYLHFDVGQDDEFSAQFGHRRICARLKRLEVAHMETEFKGGHSGTRFRYQMRFERLGAHLRSLGMEW